MRQLSAADQRKLEDEILPAFRAGKITAADVKTWVAARGHRVHPYAVLPPTPHDTVTLPGPYIGVPPAIVARLRAPARGPICQRTVPTGEQRPASRPREQRRQRAHGPPRPSDDEPAPVAPGALRTISPAEFARDVERWLGGCA